MDHIERATYTVPETAKLLGISRSHAYELAQTGQLPTLRLGKRVVVLRRHIEKLLEK